MLRENCGVTVVSEHAAKGGSIVRVEANRRNSRRSTGPRTLEGKAISRWNAVKHGLLAKEVVISVGDGKESRAEFDNLLASLRQDLEPEGALEEMLVEKIAICYWRQRRAQRCEVGEIRRRLDVARDKELGWKPDGPNLEELFSIPKPRRSSREIEDVIQTLDEVRQDFDRLGHISAANERLLPEIFRSSDVADPALIVLANRLIMGTLKMEPGMDDDERERVTRILETVKDPETAKRDIPEALKQQREILLDLKRRTERCETLEAESFLAALSLPPGEETERILRYETAIERQLYRAIDQLERLQRQRKGEVLPPPLKIQVSGEK